jgi:hypothetical protein
VPISEIGEEMDKDGVPTDVTGTGGAETVDDGDRLGSSAFAGLAALSAFSLANWSSKKIHFSLLSGQNLSRIPHLFQ